MKYKATNTEASNQPIPAGGYKFKVVGFAQEFGKGKAAGDTVVCLELQLFDLADQTPVGKLEDDLVLNESCDWKLAQFLVATGSSADLELEIESESFVGRKGGVEVVDQKYTNKRGLDRTKSIIDRYVPLHVLTGEAPKSKLPAVTKPAPAKVPSFDDEDTTF